MVKDTLTAKETIGSTGANLSNNLQFLPDLGAERQVQLMVRPVKERLASEVAIVAGIIQTKKAAAPGPTARGTDEGRDSGGGNRIEVTVRVHRKAQDVGVVSAIDGSLHLNGNLFGAAHT